MSKYYKAEDVIKCIAQFIMTDAKRDNSNVCGGIEDYIELTEAILADLPTIEPIEENGIFKGIKPTIEVSEDCSDYYKGYCARYEDGCFCQCKNLPSVTTEQSSMVGEWIEVDDGRVSCKCSICKEEYLLYEEDVFGRNYCPNCGAKMKG